MRPLWLQWEGHMLGLVFQTMHPWQHIKTLKPVGRLLLSASQVFATPLSASASYNSKPSHSVSSPTMLLGLCYT